METVNPYAAPQSNVLPAASTEETVRREHIDTEATLKTVGVLHYLGAFVLVIAAASSFTRANPGLSGEDLLVGVVMFVFGIGLAITGYGLRRLRGWTRIPTILFSCVGLLGFPMGTLINAIILLRVAGKKGGFVLTPEYQRIIAATPHVKRKTSIVTLLLLAIFIIALIGIIAAIAIGK